MAPKWFKNFRKKSTVVSCSKGHQHRNHKEALECEKEDYKTKCAMGHTHRDYNEALDCDDRTQARRSVMSYTDKETGVSYEGVIDAHRQRFELKSDVNPEDLGEMVHSFSRKGIDMLSSWNAAKEETTPGEMSYKNAMLPNIRSKIPVQAHTYDSWTNY